MLTIGIVDDDESYVLQLSEKVRSYFFKRNIENNIYVYTHGDDFLGEIERHSFDIVFLDIEMPETDGMTIAKRLRFISHAPLIIFVTAKKCYIEEAFGLNVMAFIEKKSLDLHINQAIDSCIEVIEANKRISFKTDDGLRSFYINDLKCFYVENRKIYAITNDGFFQIYQETLKSIFNKIDSDCFIIPNRCSIVNLRYVRNTKNREIYLRDCKHVEQISRDKKKSVDESFMSFVLQQELYK